MSESLLVLSHVPVYEHTYNIIYNIYKEMLSKEGGVKASCKGVKLSHSCE